MERVVLLGSGGFGRCWEPPLQAFREQLQVVGIVEPDAPERQRSSKLYALDATATAEVLKDELERWQPTLVLDSSPFRNRGANLEKVFAVGADALVAKPMGSSLDDAERAVALAEESGRQLAVAQQMRYFPCFLTLRQLITTGSLGRLFAVRVSMALDGRGWEPGTAWRLGLEQPLLHEAGIHHFDLMRWCLDDELDVEGLAAWNPPWSPFTGDATVSGLLRTAGGVPVVYEATFAPAPQQEAVRFDSGWEIVSERGTVRVIDGEVLLDGRPVGNTTRHDEPIPLTDLNTALLDEWLSHRRAGTSAPFCGRDNLQSMKLLDQALDLAGRRA